MVGVNCVLLTVYNPVPPVPVLKLVIVVPAVIPAPYNVIPSCNGKEGAVVTFGCVPAVTN